MPFLIDKQTFTDLEIFDQRNNKNSVFNLFDRTTTIGGGKELREMFQYPLNALDSIVERQDLIRYMCVKKLPVPLNKHLLDFIEYYLNLSIDKPTHVSWISAWNKFIKYTIRQSNDNYNIQRGIRYTIEYLQELYSIVTDESLQNRPNLLEQYYRFIADCIHNTELRKIIGFNTKKGIGAFDREHFDHIFRYKEFDKLMKILKIVYTIDAFQAVAETSQEFGLIIPEISNNNKIEINGLYHLFVKNPIANDVCLDNGSNLFFITGGNMAGKSTFLKAFGVAVYLAHLGFPVAASSMCTGVFNGLFSTINIADDLNKGYSHFYNEVLRVKTVAEDISQTGNLVVIFDELFRGTNVKDAHDASFAIISAFAKVPNSIFLISSHIMEVAEKLHNVANISFGYFSTFVKDGIPNYSFLLKEGITEDRLGMLIVKNERIIEIIEDRNRLETDFQQ